MFVCYMSVIHILECMPHGERLHNLDFNRPIKSHIASGTHVLAVKFGPVNELICMDKHSFL